MTAIIDEPITIAVYDPAWVSRFSAEQALLCSALHLAPDRVQHIGSTAVPGLAAKPIIDVMIGVDVFPSSQQLSESLITLAYEALGEAGVVGRLYFRKRVPMAFNVHVVQHAGEHWRNSLLLKNYLIAHPPQAQRYARCKFAAVAEGSGMLLDYSTRKATIVSELLASAHRWCADA